MEVLIKDLRAAGHADLVAPLDAALLRNESAAAAAPWLRELHGALTDLVRQFASIGPRLRGTDFLARIRKAQQYCRDADNGHGWLLHEITRDGSEFFFPFVSCLALQCNHIELEIDAWLAPQTAEDGHRTYVMWETKSFRNGSARAAAFTFEHAHGLAATAHRHPLALCVLLRFLRFALHDSGGGFCD